MPPSSYNNARSASRASHWVFAALFAGAATLAGAFGGCAQGTTLTTGTGGGATSTGGTGGTGGVGGTIGLPCETVQDCPEGGLCVQIGGQKVCTAACPPECPAGSYCTLVEGDPLCVPDEDQQCGQCFGSSECKGLTDECLTAPAGDKFCARDCTVIDDCPTGFSCVERADYEALAAGTGGGGSGGGTTSGVGGGSSGAGPSLPDAGNKPPTGTPHRFCVPPDAASCPCNDKRDGVTKSCDIVNEFGHCAGDATCDGKGGAWINCTSKTPAAEICNSDDDNCDGAVDEGEVSALCGGAPLHGVYACNGGSCDLGGCDPGWAQYPAGPASDGCTCPADASEPNDVCANAADVGSVTDAGPGIQFGGTMSSDADVDVWTFATVDTNEGTTNSYHVSIDLVVGESSDDFLLDVTRGAACVDPPSGPSAGITAYDWCVDGKSADGTAGEAPCAADGPVHCNDNSAKYFVRVYRKPGAAKTCSSYKIQVAAKGGGPCDFAMQCE